MSGKSETIFFQGKQYAKMAAQNLVLPVVYRLACLLPADPFLVVFADAHHRTNFSVDISADSGTSLSHRWAIVQLAGRRILAPIIKVRVLVAQPR